MNDRTKVTVERQKIRSIGGSLYIPLSAAIRRGANIGEDDTVAFDREVLDNGELGKVTRRIERSSEPEKEPPSNAN